MSVLNAPSIKPRHNDGTLEIPTIADNEPLGLIIRKLSSYIIKAIPDTPYNFDQMRATGAGFLLKRLATSLSDNVHNPTIISALMIIKWQFSNQEDDYWGLNESRGYACEFVGWQFLTYLSRRDTIEYLLEELQESSIQSAFENDAEPGFVVSPNNYQTGTNQGNGERRPLLPHTSSLSRFLGYGTRSAKISQETDNIAAANFLEDGSDSDIYAVFCGLNALEIAAIAKAKKFLSQTIVQKVVNDVWIGAIVLWDTLSVHSKKRPQLFHERMSDPYCRLRVPLYRKSFEAVFFLSFLALYYSVLTTRDPLRISPVELGRVCSLMSLNSYFGSLIPVLKEMIFLTLTIQISPLFGYPLMLVFFCMTNILLISSITSLMSLSLTENIIPLICLRPLRLFLPSESIRQVRIVMLKVTHSPYVAIILAYESSRRRVTRRNHSPMATSSAPPDPLSQLRVPAHKLSIRRRQGFSRPVLSPGKDKVHVPPAPHPEPRGVGPGPAAAPVRLADVIETVDGLRGQIEQLTASISSSKNH
ncbi:hypothetical protein AJ79_00493 [Helicocarpus griseus UAMH5409]|uniref:Ion transport domain-containing protein n=1 Tax=Helicocarpus griseus UAMH5409 TaxID=1447875 RepID=A0A2B7Y2W2_9EURO|nr:hypothetical protein AJ79_00493 [Helicocarpus griseus UAMH5409]